MTLVLIALMKMSLFQGEVSEFGRWIMFLLGLVKTDNW